MTVEVFGVSGDECEGPVPKRFEGQGFSDTGFGLSRGFSKGDVLRDAFSHGEDTGNIGMKEHTITKVTELLVNVEGLGGHVDNTVIMALELEEVTDRGLEVFEVPGIPHHAHFIQEKHGIGAGDKIAQVINIENTNAGDIQIGHIGIDRPTLFHIAQGEFDKVCALATTFFAKHQIQAIRIDITAGNTVKDKHTDKESKNTNK